MRRGPKQFIPIWGGARGVLSQLPPRAPPSPAAPGPVGKTHPPGGLRGLGCVGGVSLGPAPPRLPRGGAPGPRVNAGATIVLDLPPAEEVALAPETIPLDVVFEDADIIVIDKPAGLVVHPAAGNWTGTLVNALVAHCGESLSGVGGAKRPGIVHRLDKDTTGLMVVAKTDRAHRALSRQFADHGRHRPLRRGYLAFVWGVPERPRGTIDKPIARHPRVRDKMAVRTGGPPAVTHWGGLERYRGRDGAPGARLICCRLETRRTHQIRVHLAAIGHPL